MCAGFYCSYDDMHFWDGARFRVGEPPSPPGMDISSQLFYPQERECITEIDSTLVPWQARLAQSHTDETSRQHNTGLFRGIHACFFNLDVLLCFCVLHPPAGSENTRAVDSLVFAASSHPLITPLPKQGHSVQGYVLSENLISEFVTSEGGREDSEG